MVICIIIIALGMGLLTWFIIEKVKKYCVKEAIIKISTSAVFLLLAAYCWISKGNNSLAFYVLMGLFFGALGDLFLEFKYVFKEEEKIFTYAGFIVFAIGHVFYITGMFRQFYNGQNPLYIIIPLVIGLIVGAAPILLEKVMKLNYGSMKLITYIYGVCLFSMTMCGGSLCLMTNFHPTAIMLFVGGILFSISDLILSGTYFGVGKDKPFDIISNSVTYYLAQYTIAFSLYFL